MKSLVSFLSAQRLQLRLARITLCTYALLVWPSVWANTPDLCIPQAQGVPYWGGAPDWWSPQAGGENARLYQLRTQFDDSLNGTRRAMDPRWAGALGIGFEHGAVQLAEFRAVRQGESVLMAWTMRTAPPFNAQLSKLVVGLTLNGQHSVAEVPIESVTTTASGLAPNSSTVTSCNSGHNCSADQLTSPPNWSTQGPSQPGAAGPLRNVRFWAHGTHGGQPPYPAAAAATYWSVQARLDVPSGVKTFNMWFSMQTSVNNFANPANPVNPLIYFSWPRSTEPNDLSKAHYTQFGAAGPHILPPKDWPKFHLGAAPTGSSCSGLTLASSDIAVRTGQGGVPSTTFSLSEANQLEAKVRSAKPSQQGTVLATFYRANWGTQSTGAISGFTQDSWAPIRGLIDAPGSSWSSSGAASDNTVAAPWGGAGSSGKLSAIERCEFRGTTQTYLSDELGITPSCSTAAPGTTPVYARHNCVLVTLRGAGLEFINDSAVRNMDFGKASVLLRDATIAPDPGVKSAGSAEVLLWTDRRNMPSYAPVIRRGVMRAKLIDLQPELVEINSLLTAPHKVRDVKSPIAMRMLLRDPRLRGMVTERNPDLAAQLDRYAKELAAEGGGLGEFDDLATVMPTYTVHALRLTDDVVYIDGVKHRVGGMQTSFGLFLVHEKPHFGWTVNTSSLLQFGADGTAVVSLPPGRVGDVRFRVEAVEKIRPLREYREIRVPIEQAAPTKVPDPQPFRR
jgi:hypothetical protein